MSYTSDQHVVLGMLKERKSLSTVLKEIEDKTELTEAYSEIHRKAYDPNEPYTASHLQLLQATVFDVQAWVDAYHQHPVLASTMEQHIWNSLEELIIFAKAMQVAVVG